MKHFVIIATALFLDGLSAMMTLSFLVIGAGAGALPVIGGLVGSGVAVVGTVISTSIGMVFGAGFLTMLSYNGLFSVKQMITMRRARFILVKFIPFINILPTFTILSVIIILQKRREEKKTSFEASETVSASYVQDETEEVSVSQEHVPERSPIERQQRQQYRVPTFIQIPAPSLATIVAQPPEHEPEVRQQQKQALVREQRFGPILSPANRPNYAFAT